MKWPNSSLTILIFSVLLSIIPLISCTALESGPAAIPKPEINKVVEFGVSPLTVKPRWLFAGDNAKVTATVTNKGNADGVYKAIFKVDGEQSGEETLQITQGSSMEVCFAVTITSPGAKSIEIGDSKSTITFISGTPYTIRYDKYESMVGNEANTTFTESEPYGQMVRFTCPAKPFRINKLKICAIASFVDQVSRNKQFTVVIWDAAHQKLWSQDYPWQIFTGAFATWNDLEVPNIVADNEFYVELISHTPPGQGDTTIGYATTLSLAYTKNDSPSRSSYSNNGKIVTSSAAIYNLIDWCIRVEGEGGPTQVLNYDDGWTSTYHGATSYAYNVKFVPLSYPFDLRLIQLNGYRDIKDPGDRTMILKAIDIQTGMPFWQQTVPWSKVPYSEAKSGTWIDFETGTVICNHEFYIELTTNNSKDAHVFVGADYQGKNRNSEMSIDGNIINWREFSTPARKFTRDNTRWMIRAAGIPQ